MLEEGGSGNGPGPQASQVSGLLLAVDEGVSLPNEALYQRDEAIFGGIGGSCKHRLPKKYLAQRQAVKPAHQLIILPYFYRMGIAHLVQPGVSLNHIGGNPGAIFPVAASFHHIRKTGVRAPRPLDKARFIQLVKDYLAAHCEGIELRDKPDGVYLEAFDETVMRWRCEHAWERYSTYRIEWELVGYGLANSFRENTVKRERIIPQVVGPEALGNDRPDAPVFKKYSDDLFLYFAEDQDERVKKLCDAKYFTGGFLSWERDYAEALDRLKGMLMDNGLTFSDDGFFFNRVVTPNYASALILWAGLWESLPFHDPEREIIVGIPERDALYYKDNNDPLLNLQFELFIRQTYEQSVYPVSPHLFICRAGKFERFRALT